MNDELRTITKNLYKIDDLIKKLEIQNNIKNTSESSYISKNTSKPVEPKKKKIETFDLPNNSKYQSLKKTINIFVIVILVLCLMIVGKCIYKSYVSSVINECSEWEEWVTNDWASSNVFDDNESSYSKVQSSLKSYGLNLSWNKINKTVNRHWKNGGYIYSDSLKEYLISDLSNSFLLPIGNGILIFIVAVIIIIFNRYYSKYINEKNLLIDAIDKCNKVIELNVKSKEYNDIKYPELEKKYQDDSKEYEKKVEELKIEYREKINNADKEINKLNDELKLLEGTISTRYFSRAKDLAEIIEDGRADSLKEALNIMKSDDDAAELLAEQKRKNDIMQEEMERQREAEEAHNRQMERYAEQQARAAEDEARAAQEQARAIEEGNKQAKREAERARSEQKYRDKQAAAAQSRLEIAASRYESAKRNGNAYNISHYEAEMEKAKGEINRWK